MTGLLRPKRTVPDKLFPDLRRTRREVVSALKQFLAHGYESPWPARAT